MADSNKPIIESALAALKSQLLNIRESNGCYNNLIDVVERDAVNLPGKLYASVVLSTEEVLPAQENIDRSRKQSVDIVVWWTDPGDSEPLDTRLMRLYADVVKAVLADPSLGGWADFIEVTGCEFGPDGIVVSLDITYHTFWNDITQR